MPWGLASDADGNIYVADWRNDRIQKFTSDGEFLQTWGGSDAEDGAFNRPSGLAVDAHTAFSTWRTGGTSGCRC